LDEGLKNKFINFVDSSVYKDLKNIFPNVIDVDLSIISEFEYVKLRFDTMFESLSWDNVIKLTKELNDNIKKNLDLNLNNNTNNNANSNPGNSNSNLARKRKNRYDDDNNSNDDSYGVNFDDDNDDIDDDEDDVDVENRTNSQSYNENSSVNGLFNTRRRQFWASEEDEM
jgi:hypothetical protein